MRVTSKGQVTIPKAVRDQLGIEPGDILLFETVDGHGQFLKANEAATAADRKTKLEKWASRVSGSMDGYTDTEEFMETVRDRDIPLS